MTPRIPTAFAAVNCDGDRGRSCGLVYLTQEEYDAQMRCPDCMWCCPLCGGGADWSDDVYDAWIEAQEEASSAQAQPVASDDPDVSVDAFRREVHDKLGVVFNGCNSTPLERSVHRKQCEDFLVELYTQSQSRLLTKVREAEGRWEELRAWHTVEARRAEQSALESRTECDESSWTGEKSAHIDSVVEMNRLDSTPNRIDDGNVFIFCDHVSELSGCIRGAGHNGPHVFAQRNFTIQAPVVLAPPPATREERE